MEIIRMPVGVYAANCYLVYSKDDKKGVVIDPGGNPNKIIEEIEKQAMEVVYILLTHGHGDHIGAVDEVREHFNVPVWINEDDEYLLGDEEANLSITMPSKPIQTKADKIFKDGDIIKLGNLDIKAIQTPGHTPGGTTFDIDGNLFTGDTLFAGSVGRSDFARSSGEDLIKGIKEKLLIYPDETEIFPGHGPSSTIKAEKRSNPFIQD